jgi:hypothetical protein
LSQIIPCPFDVLRYLIIIHSIKSPCLPPLRGPKDGGRSMLSFC